MNLPDPVRLERIHQLWDELADFDVASVEAVRSHLLTGLCQLVQAVNACWIGAVRMGKPAPSDPVQGWRPRIVHYLHPPTPSLHNVTREQVRSLESGTVDITTARNVALAGRFRTNRLADLVDEDWFSGDYYGYYYRQHGFSDAIWAGVPINEDTEIYFGVYRGLDESRFTETERDLVAYTLRGLRWLYRQQMLSFGLLVAQTPLTPAERDVLPHLLSGQPEKKIAACLGQSVSTTHEYVLRIYRKYGVKSRAALIALWLGHGG